VGSLGLGAFRDVERDTSLGGVEPRQEAEHVLVERVDLSHRREEHR
jgi:hypothetical protein